MEQAHPTVVVPGITASELIDYYPVDPETVWSAVFNKGYDRLTMHPDDVRYERIEPAYIREGGVFDLVYRELIEELSFNLPPKRTPTPVYPFAYDWRQPLETAADRLATFVDEVIERTLLMKSYYDDPAFRDDPRVNLVGHSMGGLVIAGYLAKQKKKSRVHKVATIATPFQGSVEAVIKLATGLGGLGSGLPSSREREAARMIPAIYYLLPNYKDAVEALTPGLSQDIFDPAVWQPSVLETITDFFRRYSREPDRAEERSAALFREMLTRAGNFLNALKRFKLSSANLQDTDWLFIAGVGEETRVRVALKKEQDEIMFDVPSMELKNQVHLGETGDNTVPYFGAVPPFWAETRAKRKLVCVVKDDFAFLGEALDRTLGSRRLAGFHGVLPAMDLVHRLICRHLSDGTDKYGNTWGRRAPDLAPGAWDPPFEITEKNYGD